ncbi:NADP-dependent phosphogluconate dehydrogenase [Pseudooceanicola sp.]|uniref:NADP-dependent phosphogluconate dehydrogenase n=1 Tax=Pseudooceanicola sp. TaxID=1914328 RepID=UPI003517A382
MSKAQIGVYGLGTMGSALALNLAEKGFRVAVTNRETDWIAPFLDEAGPLAESILPAETLEDFVAALTPPRVMLFMIPSGPAMDDMIDRLRPLLAEGDTLIDGGNADFNDTRRRVAALEGSGLHFVGMGVSGGEEGARHGPSMMVGGSDHSWTLLRPMVEAIAARFRGDPCVAHVGPDGAGHFVKTVHNGIEYADMELIAEIYGLLRDGAGWEAPRIGALFAGWQDGPLASYLVEITAKVLAATDPETGRPVTEVILDSAGQKGTGRWTVIEALKLGQSASAIEGAVGARSWSSEKSVREQAGGLRRAAAPGGALPEADTLADALLAARILAHAQGFRVLSAASAEFGWALDLARIAEIWRAGCIIRSALLDDIAAAVRDGLPEDHLILAPALRDRLADSIGALRATVVAAMQAGLPVPSRAAARAWYAALRQPRGTADLIQAQRDFFGAHGFARIDRPGSFHGPWWPQAD